MPITASISLNVTPLTDNTIAFANAAAWNNYFNDLDGIVTIDPVTVTGYTAVAYAATAPYDLTIDAEQYVFPTLTQFTSLLNAYTALANNFELLRNELYAAGLISAP